MSRHQAPALLLIILLILQISLSSAQAGADLPTAPSTFGEPLFNTTSPALESEAGLPASIPSDWWTTVQEDIHQSEYNVTWQAETCLPDVPAATALPTAPPVVTKAPVPAPSPL